MLTLDHIPFHAPRDRLRSAFARLGFRVSPPGRYASPARPGHHWLNHGVFLRDNWFDLIDTPARGATPFLPSGFLLRTDDLEATVAELGEWVAGTPYELVRHWDEDFGLPPERFTLADLSWKAGPLGVSIIRHEYPCADTEPQWYAHPNGANAIVGLTLCDERAPEVPAPLRRAVDLSWFSVGGPEKKANCSITISVGVDSLEVLVATLASNDVAFTEQAGTISPDVSEFGCTWQFVE